MLIGDDKLDEHAEDEEKLNDVFANALHNDDEDIDNDRGDEADEDDTDELVEDEQFVVVGDNELNE